VSEIIPNLDRVVVKVAAPEETSTGGIILPPNAQEKPLVGTVLAVGPGRWSDAGDRIIPPGVYPGDVVLFSQYGGTEFNLGDEAYTVLAASEILIILNRPNGDEGQV
jgi:chaperonin GroES